MAGKRTAPLSGEEPPAVAEEQRRGDHGFRGHRYYSVARAEHDVAVVTAALTHVVCATEPPAPQQLGTRTLSLARVRSVVTLFSHTSRF
jgi:hypothetical protein